jgi:hypothetical protein
MSLDFLNLFCRNGGDTDLTGDSHHLGSGLNARLPLNNLFQPNYKLYLLCRYLRYRN